MEIVFFWAMFSIAIGFLADRYGRSAAGWIIFALVLSPLLAAVFLLAVGPRGQPTPTAATVVPAAIVAEHRGTTSPAPERAEPSSGRNLVIFFGVIAFLVLVIVINRKPPATLAPLVMPSASNARIETGLMKVQAPKGVAPRQQPSKWDAVKEAAEITHRCNEEQKKPRAAQRASVIAQCPRQE